MHIVVTDVLSCPRCGPEFGLIVLADRLEDRRVVEGWLGCANCRNRYPIHAGVPDLRLNAEETDWAPVGGDADRALRIAALLGVGHAMGTVLVYGADAGLLGGIAQLLPNARVVGAGPEPIEGAFDAGLDTIRIDRRLPLHTGSIRGVAFATPPSDDLLDDALRALAPGAHLLIDPVSPEILARLASLGADLLLHQDGAAVASHPGRR
jgi:uncharacterized protein YbaR (Trm112 family)